jgi:uncharacterized membrane protein YozB (DUF420 family)
MAKRLTGILYSLTALATLIVGLASFDSMCAALSPINQRWLASIAVIDFATPTVFLLAGISAIWTSDKSRAPRWICAAGVLIVLMLVFVHHGVRWRLFLEAAGALISLVFILGSLVRQASTIAGIGIAVYALLQAHSSIETLREMGHLDRLFNVSSQQACQLFW